MWRWLHDGIVMIGRICSILRPTLAELVGNSPVNSARLRCFQLRYDFAARTNGDFWRDRDPEPMFVNRP